MLPGLPGMITLANQRDDNWPFNKYQKTPAANQPLPTPCLCSKLLNKCQLSIKTKGIFLMNICSYVVFVQELSRVCLFVTP